MLYYRARFYDPQLGRFVSEDPIGFAGGDANWYGYVANNPVRKVDPTGLDDADRIWEEQSKPPRPERNDWYWSHNESADNSPSWDKPSGPNPTLGGDGGIFTAPTFKEFITATERARQPCKPLGERWWTSVKETNQALPGTFAPPGFGLITGPGASMQKDERYNTLKLVMTLLIFAGCLIASLATQSWLVSLLLFGGAFACAEFLGVRLFKQREWVNRLSVEHAGFSITRIVLGVVVVLMVFGVIVLVRLLYLQLIR